MALQDKYRELVDAATASGVTSLQVREQDNVLYIDGEAPSGVVKDKLWDIYGKIDTDFRAGDVVMNINVSSMAPGAHAKVTTEKSNLNIRKGPGTDQPIVGKAGHHENEIQFSFTLLTDLLPASSGSTENAAFY